MHSVSSSTSEESTGSGSGSGIVDFLFDLEAEMGTTVAFGVVAHLPRPLPRVLLALAGTYSSSSFSSDSSDSSSDGSGVGSFLFDLAFVVEDGVTIFCTAFAAAALGFLPDGVRIWERGSSSDELLLLGSSLVWLGDFSLPSVLSSLSLSLSGFLFLLAVFFEPFLTGDFLTIFFLEGELVSETALFRLFRVTLAGEDDTTGEFTPRAASGESQSLLSSLTGGELGVWLESPFLSHFSSSPSDFEQSADLGLPFGSSVSFFSNELPLVVLDIISCFVSAVFSLWDLRFSMQDTNSSRLL